MGRQINHARGCVSSRACVRACVRAHGTCVHVVVYRWCFPKGRRQAYARRMLPLSFIAMPSPNIHTMHRTASHGRSSKRNNSGEKEPSPAPSPRSRPTQAVRPATRRSGRLANSTPPNSFRCTLNGSLDDDDELSTAAIVAVMEKCPSTLASLSTTNRCGTMAWLPTPMTCFRCRSTACARTHARTHGRTDGRTDGDDETADARTPPMKVRVRVCMHNT